ncbi:MAG: acetate/propionate family kinase [Chloroherpetonaceae bacterium]|nr:acetate/propionate family kinase [Chthonomonadaceae bacterium]MDW8206759.1 acetate/propionate family kinase [Chloroherpetonaceae bacterium]
MRVLVVNPGSATLKCGLYQVSGPSVTALWTGVVDRVGTDTAVFRWQSGATSGQTEVIAGDVSAALHQVLDSPGLTDGPDAAGCRVVHGGERFTAPILVDAGVVEAIRALGVLAPLHNPVSADVLQTIQDRLPDRPIVAVFDTAFHRTLPPVARAYALPYTLMEQHGLWRYGFHGIAHRNVMEQLRAHRQACPARLITCHLGNGASVCAQRDGRSVETSMGLTPMEGLMMGTRSGDVDPGLVLHLQRAVGMSSAEVETLLNRESGLRGVSGVSNDLRDLERAAGAGDVRAELAMQMFAYRAAKAIAAHTVALGGVDAITFSGGIGENSATMRARVGELLAFLGVELDAGRNQQDDGARVRRISTDASHVEVYVVRVDENAQVAQETVRLLASSTAEV